MVSGYGKSQQTTYKQTKNPSKKLIKKSIKRCFWFWFCNNINNLLFILFI